MIQKAQNIMKNLRLTFRIVALAVGIAGGFAFRPAPVTANQAEGQFYVNPDGTPTDEPVDPAHPCLNLTGSVCMGTFDIDETTGLPIPGTGRNFILGPRL